MLNFIKNYLLLTLLGLGFLYIIVFLFFVVPTPVDVSETAVKETEFEAEDLFIEKLDGGARLPFKVEIADTSEKQMRGLMFRTELAENAGMLFIFDKESPHSFWMKNTLIPLDIIFIEKDGTIHHIHENAVPKDLTGIDSNGNVMYVLELAGGMTAKLGIEVGDKVISARIK